ncbi:UNVERIFIED_CONTAM: hypothetical protein FKN15_047448 [Acipenser sinensis]
MAVLSCQLTNHRSFTRMSISASISTMRRKLSSRLMPLLVVRSILARRVFVGF